jgi:membrane-associated phospholipid phosphatase
MSEPTEPAADSYRNIVKPSDTWCGFWNRHLLREYVAVAVLVAIYLILTNTVSGPTLLIPNAAPNITVAELSKLDTYIGFPLLDDIVPVWVVGVLMLAPVPLLSLTVSLPKGSLFELHSASLMTIEATVMNLLFTDVGKILAARYRPDYLARCTSFDAAGRCVAANASTELDGRRSFPSGHSSGSFCGTISFMLFAFFACSVYLTLLTDRHDSAGAVFGR